MHARVARPAAEFAPLAAISPDWARDWDALSANASEPNPFAERWFVQAAAKHLAPPADARMLAVRGDAGLLGLLPLCVSRRYGRMPVRHLTNWLSYHSFLGTPLVRRGAEADFWRAALAALDDAPWSGSFLHLAGLSEGPVLAALRGVRAAPIVHRAERALLAHGLSPDAYYEVSVRKKKRKELARLRNRLAELGTLTSATLQPCEPLEPWCGAFLTLEVSGWKGREGSALAAAPATAAFLHDALTGARAAGRLEMRRLDLDGRVLAMLINFMTPPGSFSFKIAFDEDFARFSPGVLIQRDNLAVLDRADISWMDSCAAPNHPMIDSLWRERREIVRVTVPLGGARRRATFHAARALERAAAFVRNRV